MKIKQFLKPDWRKIVIFGILLIICIKWRSNIVMLAGLRSIASYGFPLPFYSYDTGSVETITPSSSKIIWPGLIFDIIFWYLLPCLIIWIYDKRLKK